jgi:hypothetical protein
MYEVVWPRGRRTLQGIPLARRPETLAGKTVAELWNGGYRGNEVFPILEEELKRRFPGIKFVPWEEFGRMSAGVGEDERLAELPAKLKAKGCDVAIAGMGC